MFDSAGHEVLAVFRVFQFEFVETFHLKCGFELKGEGGLVGGRFSLRV